MQVFCLGLVLLITVVCNVRVRTQTRYCTDSRNVLLTSCGIECAADAPCVQYPSNTSCSEAARNSCTSHVENGQSCSTQCLNEAFNALASKFTLFVKDPKSSDQFEADGDSTSGFPSAPVRSISNTAFSDEVRTIQITGFDSTDVPKGSFKSIDLSQNPFKNAKLLETLLLSNLDLFTFPEALLPTTSLSSLWLENCNLEAIPSSIFTQSSLTELVLAKNKIGTLPSNAHSFEMMSHLDLSRNSISSFDWMLPQLTILDLSDNAITEFPSVIFSLPKLTSLNLAGNQIKELIVTPNQANILRRLNANSTLGIMATAGSCSGDATESKIQDSILCIGEGDSGSSMKSTTLVAVSVTLSILVLFGAIGFLYYRRRKRKLEYLNSPTFATLERDGGRVSRLRSVSAPRSSTAYAPPETPGFVKDQRLDRISKNETSISAFSWDRLDTAASNKRLQVDKAAHGTANNPTVIHEAAPRRSSVASRQISPNVRQLPKNEIVYTRRLAKGSFGEVWLAQYQMDFVAVKKLLTVDTQSITDFIAELNLLASFNHPRIIGLIGATWDDTLSDLQIVTECMDSGDLLTVLRQRSPTDLTWSNGKALYCLQTCEAICYLHSLQPALIHRDIKSRNILIDSVKGAKLTDFGESRERTYQRTMTAGVGTARWVAPEIILGEDYSELADIYSFGVLLSELDTHKVPYEDLEMKEEAMIVQQVAVGKLRPRLNETCPDIIKRLAHECLQFDPTLRPSATRIYQALASSDLLRNATLASSNQGEVSAFI